MLRLPHRSLMQLHRALLRIYAVPSLSDLRRQIPAEISGLIACERSAANEVFLTGAIVRPSPVPSYWGSLGPVMLAHCSDHPLLRRTALPAWHRSLRFSQLRRSKAWRRSVLVHDYYHPAGVREMLAVPVLQNETERLVLNCNRPDRDFSERDSAMIELLSYHVGYAWRNASLLHRASDRSICAVTFEIPSGRVTTLSSGIDTLPTHVRQQLCEGSLLPDRLRSWALAQTSRLQRDNSDFPALPAPYVDLRNGVRASLGNCSPTHGTLLIGATSTERRVPARDARAWSLTAREREILKWVAEGKRNAEIGEILRISQRTVGKHIENVLAKLGVETRAAATRIYWELTH